MNFNFNEAVNVSKITRSTNANDVKVGASGRVTFSEKIYNRFKLNERGVIILSDGNGNFVLGTDDTGTNGARKVGKNGVVTNTDLADLLGGRFSEWEVGEEGIENPLTNSTFYPLTQLVNGAEKRAKLNSSEEIEEEIADAQSTFEAEEEVNVFESSETVEEPTELLD